MAHLKELFAKPLYGPNVMGDALLPIQKGHAEGDMRLRAWVYFVDGGQYVLGDSDEPIFEARLAPREDIPREIWDSMFGHDEADRPIAVEAPDSR
jgi:hypothetical protein